MTDDPIIQELRDIRKNIETECEKKGQTYFSHLLDVQEKYKERVVSNTVLSPSTESEEKSA
ncbi:MAG: hypothetical protein GY757_49465 [bacterium]|nr:hypothetical protein [bacterium]